MSLDNSITRIESSAQLPPQMGLLSGMPQDESITEIKSHAWLLSHTSPYSGNALVINCCTTDII